MDVGGRSRSRLQLYYFCAQSKLLVASLLVGVSLVATGCGKSLEDLVRTNRPKIGNEILPLGTDGAVKISPGTVNSTSSDVSMKVHVTITERPLSGGDVTARVSVSRPNNETVSP